MLTFRIFFSFKTTLTFNFLMREKTSKRKHRAETEHHLVVSVKFSWLKSPDVVTWYCQRNLKKILKFNFYSFRGTSKSHFLCTPPPFRRVCQFMFLQTREKHVSSALENDIEKGIRCQSYQVVQEDAQKCVPFVSSTFIFSTPYEVWGQNDA